MAAPTHVRYRVVALATALAMVTYLDRACIGTLAPGIMRDLGLTTGVLFLIGAVSWTVVDPGRPVFESVAANTSVGLPSGVR
jgi:hypothetical protein